jgi:hypothetical protein
MSRSTSRLGWGAGHRKRGRNRAFDAYQVEDESENRHVVNIVETTLLTRADN